MANAIGKSNFDKAIAYSLVLKIWQSAAGLLSIYLIIRNFSSTLQGFYYTFISLIAVQLFVELGLYLVITNTASHEWAKLKLSGDGDIVGDRRAFSRLVSLGRFVFRWYAVASFVLWAMAGIVGYFFLGKSGVTEVNWQLPWIAQITLSSLLFLSTPFLSLLEGCDQVEQVAKFRFWQSIASSVAFWIAIMSGAELWAAPILSFVSLIFCIYYLIIVKQTFFSPFYLPPQLDCISWKREILPMQWRLAAQGLISYFGYYVFTPVMFHYHGPEVAGQMGISQQIVMAIVSISLVWVTTRVPKFGMLIAQRNFAVLDNEWFRASLYSAILATAGVLLLLVLQYFLNKIGWTPILRLLPPLPLLLLCIGTFFVVLIQCLAIYLRAHKREVLTASGVLSGAMIGSLVWILGSEYGPSGATGGYLLVMSCFTFPTTLVIYMKSRKIWHQL
jgi:O-antigen/teichoic acid export membrane protein